MGDGKVGSGKVALVTGASRGAGAGIARGLGELGYTVDDIAGLRQRQVI